MPNTPVLPVATLTLNPCLDVGYDVPELIPDQKARAKGCRFDPGGNGLNVGRGLKRLGVPCATCCVLAGEIGELVKRLLSSQVDTLDAVWIDGETRINCGIVQHNPAQQFEVDAQGPDLPAATLEQVDAMFLGAAAGGIGVLTGSVPGGVGDDIYARLAARLGQEKAKAVVDTKGALLESAIRARPFLIKPNEWELSQLVGKDLKSPDEVAREAAELVRAGVEWVCVSMGGDGAVLVGSGGAWQALAPAVDVVSTVGAGDSLVAGLVAGFAKGLPAPDCLRLGIACGGGTAAKPGTGLFTPEDAALADKVEVRTLGG